MSYIVNNSVVLRATQRYPLSSYNNITLPVATNQNDVIIVVAGAGNSSWATGNPGMPINTFSGAGATWSGIGAANHGAQGFAAWVGYGASAGQTTISMGGSLINSVDGGFAVAIFSNTDGNAPTIINPLTSTISASGTNITVSGVSWNPGQLLVGVTEAFHWVGYGTSALSTTGKWNGVYTDSTAVIGNSTVSGQRVAVINYRIASEAVVSGTWDTPYTSTDAASGPVAGAMALVFNPAPLVETFNQTSAYAPQLPNITVSGNGIFVNVADSSYTSVANNNSYILQIGQSRPQKNI